MIPKSLNLNLRGLPRSATLAINERSKALQAEGRRVYRFGLGQSPFPVPESVVQTLRDHAAEKDYLDVAGLPALREAVARFHRTRDHAAVTADGVLIGPGSKELMFLLQVAFYGDLVVPTPCWVSYGPQARILGRKVVTLPTRWEDRWRLMPHQLEAMCRQDEQRPRVLILNYPGNPEGASYNQTELEQIAEVARTHRVVILSDEIYGLLHHDGNHTSIARYYPEGTIISGGLSKWCGAGGWRLGTFAFPSALSWLRDAMAAAASETYTSVSAPIQYAAVTAFDGGPEIEDYLYHSRRILKALGRWIATTLAALGIKVHSPEGAFYLMLDYSALRDSLEAKGIRGSRALVERLLDDTGVAILPGADFERADDELMARMAYVDFDGEAALKASAARPDGDLDEGFLRQWCAPVYEGVTAMAGWLS
ncbi:MAG: pyridoxal phosphate-dependent aminotransferase [Bradymonadia bacterium]